MRRLPWRTLTILVLAMLVLSVLPWQECQGVTGVSLANVFPTGRVADPMSGTPEDSEEAKPTQHTVLPGETLTSIAGRYGVDSRLLASANGIRQPDRIVAGMVLKIPQAQSTTYVVERGDTLGKIALLFGVAVRDLAEANSLENINLIRVGQRLTIPGLGYVASAAAPQTSRYASGVSALSWPVLGAISSTYGERWGRLHTGIDIAARYGTEVTSCSDGLVAFAGRKGGYGNLVMVKHDDGLISYYAHLSRIEVEPGMQILAGESVGRIGTTGNTTGAHLHFEVRKNGAAINPRRMLP